MSDFKKVSKEEFDEFVAEYPNKLKWDVAATSEPPIGSHNDFTTGKVWPDSRVTKVFLYDGSDYHGGKQPEYYIKQ